MLGTTGYGAWISPVDENAGLMWLEHRPPRDSSRSAGLPILVLLKARPPLVSISGAASSLLITSRLPTGSPEKPQRAAPPCRQKLRRVDQRTDSCFVEPMKTAPRRSRRCRGRCTLSSGVPDVTDYSRRLRQPSRRTALNLKPARKDDYGTDLFQKSSLSIAAPISLVVITPRRPAVAGRLEHAAGGSVIGRTGRRGTRRRARAPRPRRRPRPRIVMSASTATSRVARSATAFATRPRARSQSLLASSRRPR